MKNNIYIDPRWKNAGGIGTFFEKINIINRYEYMNISGSPSKPVDCIYSAKAISQHKNGVFFFPGYIPPLYSRSPYVFTIHDLNHLDRKENSSFSKVLFYNTVIKNGCNKASYIFTVSNFSKKRIIEWAGIDEDKVINVGNGVSENFHPDGEKLSLNYDYVLCVSNRKGHKNEVGTLEGFNKARIDPKIKIIFTGNPDAFILNKVKELNIQDRVIFTGYISEEYLTKLYRTALCVVFVSFYEGFGLPIVEAQASGTPVVTSHGSSLGEISGDGAFLVDPYSHIDISNGITELCMNQRLRTELIAKGLVNCKRFSWEKTASIVDQKLVELQG